MSEKTKSRKPSTPQLDRVIDAIERGDYDEKFIELHRALEMRQDILKAQVLEQVRQVFGKDAEVVTSEKTTIQTNPFVEKAERESKAKQSSASVLSMPSEQIDDNQVTEDALAGLPISDVEHRMVNGENVTDIENRGAIISGLSSSQIGE